MIKALWNNIWGYIVVELKGNALERLINRISGTGIELWDIQRIKQGFSFCMLAKDFHRLRPLIRYRKCTVRIIRKKGLPFITFRTSRRKALLLGVLVFFILLKTLSSFIWFIKIDGTETVPVREIAKIVHQCGINRGMLTKAVNLSGLEHAILSTHSKVSWVDASIKGTLLHVKIVEKKVIDETDLTNVIAARPGVVTHLIVFKGKPIVKEGQTVKTGDVLIEAATRYDSLAVPNMEGNLPLYLPPLGGEIEPAMGIVKARVWYEGYGEAEVDYQEELPTGREERVVRIKIGSAIFHFSGLREVKYEHYRVEKEVKSISVWRNIHLPIEIINEDYLETVIYRENRSPDLAKFLAKERALKSILNSITPGAIIVQAKSFLIDGGETENNIVRVKVLLEVEEDIAQPLPQAIKEEE